MNEREIHEARRLLADRVDRTELIGSDTEGGLSLTAHWLDGGQTLFHTIGQVLDHLAHTAIEA